MKKVVVVAVHPDDETLGCGGTLLKRKSLGDELYCLFVTYSLQNESRQREMIEKVSELYGFKKFFWLKIPTTKTDTYSLSEIISKISEVFNEIEPNAVYLPSACDTHHDHGVIFKAAWNCVKSFRYPFVKEVYSMEIPSETDFADNVSTTPFVPNCYIDISDFIEKKIEILSVYKSEIGVHPFPRNIDCIKAHAMVRGSQCNAFYAEAFTILKYIN